MAGLESFAAMAEWTEQMYAGLEKMESALLSDQLTRYHREAAKRLNKLTEELSRYQGGELLNQQRKSIGTLCDGFERMKSGIDSKYKIYLRGCGKAGKSTLLNALLSLSAENGSRMAYEPATFTIDTYTDELPAGQAEIRRTAADGRSQSETLERENALRVQSEENEAFKASRKKCDEMIRQRTEKVFLESEREDIKYDIYRHHLLKTSIREIVWGIGENPFFHNCVLIDTPGLAQDLRFTNAIEDVKEYEIDGIIWVIRDDSLSREAVVKAYQEEMQTFQKIYAGGNVIGVINMQKTGPEWGRGGKGWNRILKRAESKFCGKYGFSEVIGVNAKLAYDGNLENDSQKLAASNLAELRTRINQMFVERISEQVRQEKLEKMESFLNNLYRDVEAYCAALEKRCADYDSRAMKIEQLGQECKEDLRSSLSSLYSRHMSQVRNNIRSNLSRLTEMQRQGSTDNSFIQRQIADADTLTRQARDIAERCEQKTYDRFNSSRSLCIISDFRTDSYALQAFEKNAGKFSVQKQSGSVSLDLRLESLTLGRAILDTADEVVSSLFFGGFFDSVSRGINRIRQAVKPLDQQVYEAIDDQLSPAIHKISMDEAVEKYVQRHMQALDTSMALACGKREDIQKIVDFEQEFLQNRTKMEWEAVGLQELIE